MGPLRRLTPRGAARTLLLPLGLLCAGGVAILVMLLGDEPGAEADADTLPIPTPSAPLPSLTPLPLPTPSAVLPSHPRVLPSHPRVLPTPVRSIVASVNPVPAVPAVPPDPDVAPSVVPIPNSGSPPNALASAQVGPLQQAPDNPDPDQPGYPGQPAPDQPSAPQLVAILDRVGTGGPGYQAGPVARAPAAAWRPDRPPVGDLHSRYLTRLGRPVERGPPPPRLCPDRRATDFLDTGGDKECFTSNQQ
jgi:hypothetical protein